jgi:hypothetical protein
MALINFGYRVDMFAIDPPLEVGAYIVAYDLDGVLKQKDHLGVVTLLGSGYSGPQGPPGPVGPAGLTWSGAWVATQSYFINYAVGYASASWWCISPITGATSNTGPDVDTTHWTLLAAQGSPGSQGGTGSQGLQGPQGEIGLNWIGDWIINVYDVRDAVYYNGSSYVCIASTVGTETLSPDTNTVCWKPLALKGDVGLPGVTGSSGSQTLQEVMEAGRSYSQTVGDYTYNLKFISSGVQEGHFQLNTVNNDTGFGSYIELSQGNLLTAVADLINNKSIEALQDFTDGYKITTSDDSTSENFVNQLIVPIKTSESGISSFSIPDNKPAGEYTLATTDDVFDVLPSQTGNAGKFLSTNGTVASWTASFALGIIATSSNITTDTLDINGLSQLGRCIIIDNGTYSINLTVNGATGFSSTYLKHGTASVTFLQGSGRTLVQVDGTAVLNGVAGSTATLLSYGTTDYLRVNNA